MDTHPTYLAKIVQRDASDLGYCNASGVVAGERWVYPNKYRVNRVCRFQWPEYITAEIITFDNSKVAITNSDIEVAALVLQELVFHRIIRAPAWRNPTSGRNNTPTVDWAFKVSATINPVLANLLSIRSYHNRHHRLSPSVFYHLCKLNTISNDTSHRFNLSPCHFFAFFHSTYHP